MVVVCVVMCCFCEFAGCGELFVGLLYVFGVVGRDGSGYCYVMGEWFGVGHAIVSWVIWLRSSSRCGWWVCSFVMVAWLLFAVMV